MQYKHVDTVSTCLELKNLLDLNNPPKTLYYRGDWNPQIFTHVAAVVGSRKITEYGKRSIEKLIPQLVFEGKTIVSGFMYGVDQYAHQTCIECGGKTIAVFGWGITNSLSLDEEKLANQIVASGGLLLSEWENQISTLWTFPVRNRIVAALSQDVYIVEAALKSGSLLTADIGVKLKRKVWAVPGPITSKVSEGTNMLIRTDKAKMWISSHETPKNFDEHDPLLKLLQSESLTANELARKLHQPISQVGAQLSLHIVSGQIIEREGKYSLNYVG